MEHLKTLMRAHSMTQADLARLLERDKSAVTLLMQGKRQLKAQEAVVIAEHLGVAVNEVLGVDATRGAGLSEPIMIPFQSPPRVAAAKDTDVITRTDAGYFIEVAHPYGAHAFALEVADESMVLAGLLKGDIVVADPDSPVHENQPAVCQHYEAGAAHTLIRLYQPPHLIARASETDAFPALSLDVEDVRLVAPIMQVMRLY